MGRNSRTKRGSLPRGCRRGRGARASRILRIAVPLLLLLGSAPARGGIVSFTIQGQITAVGSAVATAFSVGEPVTITYAFETTTSDSAPNPDLGSYAAVTGLSFDFGGYTGGLGPGTSLLVVRNGDAVGGDSHQIFIDALGPDVNGRTLVDLNIGLEDSSDTVFTSDLLPLALQISDFDFQSAILYFTGSDNNVSFVITSISSSAAPTPVAWAAVSPDVTTVLGVIPQTAADEDVALDDLAGNVALTPLGALPAASDVSGYERLASGDALLCFDTAVDLPGPLHADPGDVVRLSGSAYTLEFDASANGVPDGTLCDAIALQGSSLLLSFDVSVGLPGGVVADDEDLVRLDGPSSWSLFFDGSAAGVPDGLDLDAAYAFASGRLALSFDGSGQLGGIDFDDEDVLERDGAAGTWLLAFDGSSVDPDWAAADLDAVALPEPDLLVLLGSGTTGLWMLRRARIRRSRG